MRIASCIFGFCVALGFSGAFAVDSTDMPLKFEKGKSYTFQVNFQGFGYLEGQQSKPAGTSTMPEKSGQSSTGQTEQTGQETGQETGQQTGQKSGKSPLNPGWLDKSAFEYKVNVQDTKDNEWTLNVDVAHIGGMGATSSTPGATSSTSTERPAASATGERHPLGTLNVTVDKDGVIKDIRGWENFKWHKSEAGASSAKPSGSESTGAAQQESGSQTSRSSTEGASASGMGSFESQHPIFVQGVRNHLHAILGGGLHEKKLETGRYYYLRTSAGQPSGATDKSGATGSAGASGQASGQAGGSIGGYGASAGMRNLPLDTVLYRFEGTTKQGDRELARFTVMVPERTAQQATGQSGAGKSESERPSGAQSERPSGAQSERPSGEGSSTQAGQQMSDQALAQAGWKRVGEATYWTKDGLLENFNVDLAWTGTGAFSSPDMSRGPTITIRRVEAGTAPSSSPSGTTRDKDDEEDK